MESPTDRADVQLFAVLRDQRERRARGSRQLWAMTPAQRQAAMWRCELCFAQLQEWTARAPHEVPLLGGELAWIAMHTPEWAEADDPSRPTKVRSRPMPDRIVVEVVAIKRLPLGSNGSRCAIVKWSDGSVGRRFAGTPTYADVRIRG